VSNTIGAGNPVLLGTANGLQVIINPPYAGPEPWVPAKVQFIFDYQRNLAPKDWPSPPGMTGTISQNLDFAKTLPAGSTMVLHGVEVRALVALGVAAIV
jgi:hypothetical protein